MRIEHSNHGTEELAREASREIFGPRWGLAEQFAHNLAVEGERRGLIGPRELPRLWERHLYNSALLAPIMTGHVADVGSGAGLPGIVLAIARPDVTVILIEPMERRTIWLTEQIEELSLENARVERARAEDLSRAQLSERSRVAENTEAELRVGVDQVTARAVGALAKLIPIAAPLLREGGELVLMKGSSVDDEIDAARKMHTKYDVREIRVDLLGADRDTQGLQPTRVFRGVVHRPSGHQGR